MVIAAFFQGFALVGWKAEIDRALPFAALTLRGLTAPVPQFHGTKPTPIDRIAPFLASNSDLPGNLRT